MDYCNAKLFYLKNPLQNLNKGRAGILDMSTQRNNTSDHVANGTTIDALEGGDVVATLASDSKEIEFYFPDFPRWYTKKFYDDQPMIQGVYAIDEHIEHITLNGKNRQIYFTSPLKNNKQRVTAKKRNTIIYVLLIMLERLWLRWNHLPAARSPLM